MILRFWEDEQSKKSMKIGLERLRDAKNEAKTGPERLRERKMSQHEAPRRPQRRPRSIPEPLIEEVTY